MTTHKSPLSALNQTLPSATAAAQAIAKLGAAFQPQRPAPLFNVVAKDAGRYMVVFIRPDDEQEVVEWFKEREFTAERMGTLAWKVFCDRDTALLAKMTWRLYSRLQALCEVKS